MILVHFGWKSIGSVNSRYIERLTDNLNFYKIKIKKFDFETIWFNLSSQSNFEFFYVMFPILYVQNANTLEK